jgi:hypothetical protein
MDYIVTEAKVLLLLSENAIFWPHQQKASKNHPIVLDRVIPFKTNRTAGISD